MKKIKKILCFLIVVVVSAQTTITAQTIEKIASCVWKVSYGTPEKFKPSDFKEAPALDALKLGCLKTNLFRN